MTDGENEESCSTLKKEGASISASVLYSPLNTHINQSSELAPAVLFFSFCARVDV